MTHLAPNPSLEKLFGELPLPWERADDGAAPTIDDLTPYGICHPRTVEEAATIVAWADRSGLAVSPVGGATKLGLGNRLRRLDLALSTRKLDRILEYEPANLTVTVEAGIPLAHLQQALGERGQWLALDPPHADRATIGGILATNASGPRRLGYGAARDLVIGTTVVLPDGRIARAGGKVVKNVAGYDLNKLYIGSLGTLAVLVEATFKVAPRPPVEEVVVAQFADVAQVRSMAHRVLMSPLMPAAIDLLNAPASRRIAPPGVAASDSERGVLVALLASGTEATVRRQVRDFQAFCDAAGAREQSTLPTEQARLFWRSVSEFAGADGAQQRLRLKASVPAADVPRLLATLEATDRSLGARPSIVAHVGSGIVYAAWEQSGIEASAVVEVVASLREVVRGIGSVVVEQCAPDVKAALDVWGYDGDALSLMRRIKQQFDPKDTLNPGRFVGGI